MNEARIVIVEDDTMIAELIEFNLQNDGYDTRRFGDGPTMLAALPQLMPVALFILDIMLPGPDGFEILKRLKSNPETDQIPVLMLTARSSETDKVKGLTIGADDYQTKPFGIREFLARVNALLRRYGRKLTQDDDRSPQPISRTGFGPILIDDARHRVFVDGKEIDLTNREYELLKYLIQNRGIAFSRDELLNAVWGYDYGGETRTVDVHIRQLRRKIEIDDANPILIETVRGRGYRFTDRQDWPDQRNT
jgi:two-component system alkaline phosphatase synthesis response regulator PhoP